MFTFNSYILQDTNQDIVQGCIFETIKYPDYRVYTEYEETLKPLAFLEKLLQ